MPRAVSGRDGRLRRGVRTLMCDARSERPHQATTSPSEASQRAARGRPPVARSSTTSSARMRTSALTVPTKAAATPRCWKRRPHGAATMSVSASVRTVPSAPSCSPARRTENGPVPSSRHRETKASTTSARSTRGPRRISWERTCWCCATRDRALILGHAVRPAARAAWAACAGRASRARPGCALRPVALARESSARRTQARRAAARPGGAAPRQEVAIVAVAPLAGGARLPCRSRPAAAATWSVIAAVNASARAAALRLDRAWVVAVVRACTGATSLSRLTPTSLGPAGR